MPDPETHPFANLDRAAVGRAVAQIAERPGEFADVFFERVEVVELPPDDGDGGPGIRVRREEGMAVRLVREGRSWLAVRDEIAPRSFSDALRRVARVMPAAAYPEPRLDLEPPADAASAPEVLEMPARLQREVRARRVAFPLRLTVRRHRRWVQVVRDAPVMPAPEFEQLYSVAVDLPWREGGGRWGALFADLDDAAERLADTLVDLFRARQAAPPEPSLGTVVLAPAAAAVFLHEAVAHALEADVLALGGDPEAAVGVRLGPVGLSVLDDPTTAPASVRRRGDDEGREVRRRWLLRDGVVGEPLADATWAAGSEVLSDGAGRRGGRHDPPGPRSTHLELLPGELGEEELLAGSEGGLWLAEAVRGSLDPRSGTFRLDFPAGRRIRSGAAAESTGPCRLAGSVAGLLASVAGIGREAIPAGAGWCAKGGQRMPVWATAPALRLEGVEVAGWS